MHYLIGHLIGDYILQNDWMASNKIWKGKYDNVLVALIHGALVTLAIALCGKIAGYEWASWKLIVIWLSHSVQDCFRLSLIWMLIFGQFEYFKKEMPQAYVWACIVVDNVFHLLLLFILVHL